MEGPIHEGAYFRNFTVDCFFNYGERIWWWKKAGGGWLSLKDQNFGGNNVHCCRPRKSVFRVQPPDIYNRPSPSCKNPHSLNDGKCKAFLVIMIFFCMRIKNGFHINGFALSLALKQRLEATRKWPNIAYWFSLSDLASESNISCGATYSEMRIKPAEDSSRYSVFLLLLFSCNSVFAGFVFCKIETNFASFFFPWQVTM